MRVWTVKQKTYPLMQVSLWVCLFHHTSQKVKMTSDNKEIRGEEVVRWDLADSQLKMNITKGTAERKKTIAGYKLVDSCHESVAGAPLLVLF